MTRVKVGLRHIGVPFVVVLLCMANSMADEAKTAAVDFFLPSTTLSLHEPVIVTVKVRNSGTKPITLHLGRDRKTGFIIGLTPPNKTHIVLTNPEPKGIYDLGDVEVQAGETFTQRLHMNQWYDFAATGTYLIDIRMLQPPMAEQGSRRMEATTFRGSFEIGPRENTKIASACERLVAEIKNSESAAEWAEAATELSYIGDPVAVPYIQEAMDQQPMVAYTLAYGLAKIGNDAAAGALLTELQSTNQRTAEAAWSALTEIQNTISNPNLRETVKRSLSKIVAGKNESSQ